jgi:hypothetical protein
MSLTENQISELETHDDDSGDESYLDDDPSDDSPYDSKFEGSFSNNLRTIYF